MAHPDAQVTAASELLKALANPNRLAVLCLLNQRELNVGELEAELGLRQPTLSQQLARLREEELVATRRDGKQIYYRLASEPVRRIIKVLHELFCEDVAQADGEEARRGVLARVAG